MASLPAEYEGVAGDNARSDDRLHDACNPRLSSLVEYIERYGERLIGQHF